MLTKEELLERRNNLLDKMDDNSFAIIFAGVSKSRSEDEDYSFSINRNFYYLTGIEQEGSILTIRKNEGLLKETLYLSNYDPLIEKWTGKRLTLKEASNISAVDNCLYLTQAEIDIKKTIDQDRKLTLYLDFSEFYDIKSHYNVNDLKKEISEHYPTLKIDNIYPSIIRLRMKKSKYEIECFKTAIENTNKALKVLLKESKDNVNEYYLSSLFYHNIHSFEHSELSFPTIVAAGKNATCLHYTTSFDTLHKDDLVLYDLGAEYKYYCADISRTYPIGDKYNSLEKKIYEIVLGANKLVIEKARPGITIKELNTMVTEFMAKECVKEKLIDKEEDIKNVYFHSVSHFIGLDTHDPAFSKDDTTTRYGFIPLEEGNVISDEPGLYFEKLGIGIRIEDDLLITRDGCECLSKDIIKEIKDIEEFKRR